MFFENDFFADPEEFVLAEILFYLGHRLAHELDVAPRVRDCRLDPVDADVGLGLLVAAAATLIRIQQDGFVGVGHGEVGEGAFPLLALVQVDDVDSGDFHCHPLFLRIVFQIAEETG